MIEKLSEYKITSRDGAFINAECNTKIINTLVLKINELVDAVNSIISVQEKLIDSRFVVETKHEEPAENVQDMFAEQRRWIGKLCWFWTFRRENAIIGVLTDFEIDEPHFRMDGLGWYEHCEPVKPDDPIIYKGE